MLLPGGISDWSGFTAGPLSPPRPASPKLAPKDRVDPAWASAVRFGRCGLDHADRATEAEARTTQRLLLIARGLSIAHCRKPGGGRFTMLRWRERR